MKFLLVGYGKMGAQERTRIIERVDEQMRHGESPNKYPSLRKNLQGEREKEL